MRKIYCDLCGDYISTGDADTFKEPFVNNLAITSWKTMARQKMQIECAYDLCEDCAKRIHRKLTHIANNYTWRHGNRPWED